MFSSWRDIVKKVIHLLFRKLDKVVPKKWYSQIKEHPVSPKRWIIEKMNNNRTDFVSIFL
jgi:hypothetical protein